MTRPHIVLLMADQLRADVLGCYGGQFGATPRLDELAAGSIVFNRHLTNCPLCVPARITQLTGTWPHVHGAIVNAWDKGEEPYGTSRGLKTWYESLAEAGYRVEHVGVNHLRFDPPLDRRHGQIRFHAGRAEYDAMLQLRGRKVDLSACRSPCVDYDAGRAVVHEYTNPNTVPWPGPVEEFYDGWIADRLVEQIERADPSQPLAIMGEFWSPHCPLTVPEPYYSMFDPDALALPANVGRWYPGQSPMQLFNLPGHVGASTPPAGWRKAWAVYLGMVRLLDECIGRVLDALARRGILDNCLLMFTSDHGEMLGSHRLFQKMCMYEESIRVPMLIRPPGPAPRVGIRPVLTEHLDLPATVCDYANVPPPSGAAGKSLRPLIEDPSAPGKTEVFIEFNGNSGRSFQQRAIVTPSAKYIHNHNYPPELYDSLADPPETVNLIQTGTAQTQAGELRRRLAEWMIRTNDCIQMRPDESGDAMR